MLIPSSETTFAQASTGRDLGLDAFRGVTVLLMVIVNLQGDERTTFPLLKHAEWNGLTLADLVFPWFILIIGLSIPFALDGRRGLTLASIFRRVAVLFVVGLALGWLIRPTLDIDQLRWVGVLQRIAVVYLFCAVVARVSSTIVAPAALAVICLTVHTGALLLLTAPGEAGPSMIMGQGVSGWLDRALLPGRLHRSTWDPEGALSTLPAVGTALLGVAIMRWRRGGASNEAIVVLAIGLLGAALALIPVVPLNKALWTASYALSASASGLALWIVLVRLSSVSRIRRWLALPLFAGQTALTLYVVHMLLIAILVRKLPGGTIWTAAFDALQGEGLPDGVTSLVFSMLAAGLSLAPLPWLRRRGLLVRA